MTPSAGRMARAPMFCANMRRIPSDALLGAALCRPGAAPTSSSSRTAAWSRRPRGGSGDTIEIGLPGGGSFTVDLARVDRIVEDEVVSPEVARRAARRLPAVAYDLSYRPERKPLFGRT